MSEATFAPCVGSGMCCKKAPCPFGEAGPDGGCIYLEERERLAGNVVVYRCGRYEWIQKQPGADFSPAFGAGCCQPLFNENRRAILKVLR